MTADRLQILWKIYEAARNLPKAEQRALVESTSVDAEMISEVLALLEAPDSQSVYGSSDASDEVSIGTKVGRYVITGFLGRGGIGEVYSAHDTELGRLAALKFLKPALSGSRLALERFIREAKAASALNHPNIITIHEIIQSESRVAIAMELVDGVSLRTLCGDSIAIDQAVSWGLQIGRALGAAHAIGIVHRDVKPENLMVRRDGCVKVLDFGLAYQLAIDFRSSGLGVPVGTLRYMSPEQTRGETLTGASDVFSLGLVLYELLTGRHAFGAGSPLETAHAIATQTAPPPSILNSFIPQRLDRFIQSMLSRDPGTRPTASEVVDVLVRIGRVEPTQAAAARAGSAPMSSSTLRPTPSPSLPRLSLSTPEAEAPVLTAPLKRARFQIPIKLVGVLAILCTAGAAAWLLHVKKDALSARASAEMRLVVSPGPDDPISPRYVYAIGKEGSLRIYVDDSRDEGGFAHWIAQSVSAPPIQNVNWADFQNVLAGGDGVFYGIGKNDSVTYFRLLDPWRNKGTLRWSADSGRVIGKFQEKFPVYAALSRLALEDSKIIRGGLIWAADSSGKTRLFEHGWNSRGEPLPLSEISHWSSTPPNSDIAPQLHGPRLPAGQKCPDCRLLEGGNGITYASRKDGVLLRFRNRGGNGGWVSARGNYAQGQFATQVGGGWEGFQSIMAEPGAYLIEGYVSTLKSTGGATRVPLSLSPGDSVRVRASTFSPAYSVRLLRLQRRRSGDREMASGLIDGIPITATVKFETQPGGNFKKEQRMGMNGEGAGWPTDGAGISLPKNARSGIYAAELTTPSGGRYLAPFVVRPPLGSRNRIAVIANTSTWNAYNQWGGGSHFASFRTFPAGQPQELSYERPLTEAPLFGGPSAAMGLTDRNPRAFNQLVRAEVWIVSQMDRFAALDARYASDVFSDVDLDAGTPNLSHYSVLILQTLPEYWTDRMRDNLDTYLNGGGHLIYLGGRGLFERTTITSAGKLKFKGGPGSQPSDLFRWSNSSYRDGRSERAVLGTAFEASVPPTNLGREGEYFVIATPHPFLSNHTGLVQGSKLGDAAGVNANLRAADGEYNSYFSLGTCPEVPGNTCAATHTTLNGTILAYSAPDSRYAPITRSSIVYRKTDAGSGWVFSVGSLSFGGVLAIDPTLQQIVRNALDAALDGVAP